METPFAPREYTSTLSAMYRGDNGPARGHGFASHSSGLSPSTASMPLSIPSASSLGDVPPPLPPPRYVPGADGPRMEYRGPLRPDDDDIPHYKRRDMRDEGYHSISSTNSSRGFEPFPPPAGREPLRPHGFGLHHNHYQFNSGADSYDNAMVKSFDVRRALDNRSPPLRSALSLSAQDPSTRPQERLSLLKPLSLPTRAKQQPTTDSPNRLLETPLSSAASPLNPPPFGRAEYYSPSGLMDPDRSPRSGRANSGSIPDDATVSSRGDGYYNEQEFVSDDRLSRSEFQAVGHKRRASSPAGEQASVHSIPSPGDRLRRNEGLSRGSPTPRLAVVPQGSTPMSSGSRNGSYASGLSLTASNMSSMHSYNHGRRSPGGLSPGGTSPTDQSSSHSPYETGSLTTSPRSSISTGPHHRTLSEQNRQVMSPRKLPDMLKPTASKIQGFFMCDCCPKKPKKFETVEELRIHESEKQYECAFCGNRFKNKNEAERHQSSLHLRRHSWSCSALSGYDRAFHASTSRPGEADTCGYCGDEFPRSGQAPGRSMVRHATDQDWEDRIRHLQDVHKFRECNSSKKFYRADHFRQHLKHSHAGTSGKWTNMLENACMMEEEPAVPRSR